MNNPNITPEQYQQLIQNQQQQDYNYQNNNMIGFNPMIPVTFNKSYVTTMLIMSLILIVVGKDIENKIGYSFITFCIVLAYNIYYLFKMKRCHLKLTLAGCLMTDVIIFLCCTLILCILSNFGVISTVSKMTGWVVKCAIIQVITHYILKIEDKQKIKKLRAIEKQRQQYERKMNKIYGNRKQ